jgi:ABC-type Zn uptake system ZnuABC Zn-binding protein ZnuA
MTRLCILEKILLAIGNEALHAVSVAVSFVLLFSLSACDRRERQTLTQGPAVLNVVTTVAPITSMAENIAGDRVRVTGIVPEGMNSHTFEPIPSDTKLLTMADLILLNGLDLEIPTLRLAKANKKSGTSIVLLGNKITTEKDYLFDFSFPADKGHPNPHLWLNPQYVMRYARVIRDELVRLDPDNRDTYEKNLAAYLVQLQALDQAIETAVKTIPKENRQLLTYHDSWPYFARRYGFRIIGAVQPSDFSDPSPREVARLIDQIRIEKVPAVFGSEVFPSPVLRQIAKEAKTMYIDKLRDDELPGSSGDPQHSYTGMMLYNIRIMIEALGGSTKALLGIDPAPVVGSHADYRATQ